MALELFQQKHIPRRKTLLQRHRTTSQEEATPPLEDWVYVQHFTLSHPTSAYSEFLFGIYVGSEGVEWRFANCQSDGMLSVFSAAVSNGYKQEWLSP